MAKVTVVDSDPLVLCLNVKSNTDFDTEIERASISNNYGELAQVPSDEKLADSHSNFQPFTLTDLPAGSEISLTLDFNTTLPSGSYYVSLDGWWLDGWIWINRNYGISPFTIP